jgi:hypothetical protein
MPSAAVSQVVVPSSCRRPFQQVIIPHSGLCNSAEMPPRGSVDLYDY